MAEEKRNLIDDIVEGAQKIFDEIDKILRPEKHRKPARVPVPVRQPIPPHENNHSRYR